MAVLLVSSIHFHRLRKEMNLLDLKQAVLDLLGVPGVDAEASQPSAEVTGLGDAEEPGERLA